MKKILNLFLCSLLVFSLASCSKKAGGKREPIGASNTCQIQFYANGNKVGDKSFYKSAQVVLSANQEKTLYDALIDLQKSTPSMNIKIEGTGKDARLTSIADVTAGEFGDKSGWKYEINGNESKVSIYETKLKIGDNITISFYTE